MLMLMMIIYTHIHVITSCYTVSNHNIFDVVYTRHKFKCGKSDCNDGILRDTFEMGADSLYTIISKLFFVC